MVRGIIEKILCKRQSCVNRKIYYMILHELSFYIIFLSNEFEDMSTNQAEFSHMFLDKFDNGLLKCQQCEILSIP